jgi:DNA-binding NarL/FixJ family response regulator
VVTPITDRDAVLGAVADAGPCLVLLDLDLGPLGDGVALLPALAATGAQVLVVTGSRDEVRLAAAIAAGAVGFVPKDVPLDVLVATVRRAVAGEPVLDTARRYELLDVLRAHRARHEQTRATFESLTKRERQVLAALAEGKSVDNIAAEWFVSRATVRTQVRGVLTKLQVGTQLAAVAKARRAGWLPSR